MIKGDNLKKKIEEDKLNQFVISKFAQNYIDSEGDAIQAFALTFPEVRDEEGVLATKMEQHPDIKKEIQKFLPNDKQIAQLIRRAIGSPAKDKTISWGDKHKFIETALKLKGHMDGDSGTKVQVNIGMVVKE